MSSYCQGCGKAGKGSGYCTSCNHSNKWAATQMEAIDDSLKMQAEVGKDINAMCTKCCMDACKQLWSCCTKQCASNKRDSRKPLLGAAGAPAMQSMDLASSAHVEMIHQYLAMYKAEDMAAARAFVARWYAQPYSLTTVKGGETRFTHEELLARFADSWRQGKQLSNPCIISCHGNCVEWNVDFHTLGSANRVRCRVTSTFSPEGLLMSSVYKLA